MHAAVGLLLGGERVLEGKAIRASLGLVGASLLLLTLALPIVPGSRAPGKNPDTGTPPDLTALASSFTENVGQLGDDEVRFYASTGSLQMGFAEGAVLMRVIESAPSGGTAPIGDRARWGPEPRPSKSALVRLDFVGANRVVPQGRDPLPHPTNFLLGNDPAAWRRGVRNFGEVVYEDLYAGIDLVYRIGPDGMKYDFVVLPTADPARIRMAYEGVTSVSVSPDHLVLHTFAGDVQDAGLVATARGSHVRCAFARLGVREVGFSCEGWDRTHALVIDPLLWATFLGGSREETAMTVALDSSGSPVVAGWTYSIDFPATVGALDTTFSGGSTDAFVAKLSADGSSLIWATFIGGGNGDGNDAVFDLALETWGNVILCGDTYASDFPATPGAYDTTHNGLADAFVAKLSADGSALLWSSFLGGGGADHAWTLAYDGFGTVFVAGETRSVNFPVTPGANDVSINGLDDGFVANLSADGSTLRWATFLGGSASGQDEPWSFAIDASGNPVVAGVTYAPDFPTTPGAYDSTYSGGFTDAFVTKLKADGSALLWSTFLGGGLGDGDQAAALARDASGNFVVAGRTLSSDFPVTSGAYDTTFNGDGDAFVATLSSDGSALLWSTFLGGSGDESAKVELAASGDLVLAGPTRSADFPATPDAFDDTFDGAAGDAFVAKLSADGSTLAYSSFLGGTNVEIAEDLTLDSLGNAVLVGRVDSSDFPVSAGAFDVVMNGSYEAFVAILSLGSPPSVTITSPADGTWYNTTGVTASGAATDEGSGLGRVEVSCDGGSTWILATGTVTWVATCSTPREGRNMIRARAFSDSGQMSVVATVTVNVDLSPPAVGVTSPPSGTWFRVVEEPVSGTSTDGGSGVDRVEVSCDGGSTWRLAAGTVSWTATCNALMEGPNEILARATDRVGWMSDHRISVNIDLTPPHVAIAQPEDGRWFGSGSVTVSGAATDFGGSGFPLASPPNVSAGCTISVTSPNSWELRWEALCGGLVEGPNRIGVAFSDGVGWLSPAFITLNVDLTAPVAVISAPAEGAWFGGNAVTISGTATDEGSGLDRVEVSCDDGTLWQTAVGQSSWTDTCTALREGANRMRARAFDLVGRESVIKFLGVNVDLTPPTVTVVCVPSRGEVGTAVACALSAFDSLDPSPMISWRITRQGSPIAAGNGTRAEFTPDRPGPYVVEATAEDRTSHLGTDSATVEISERLVVLVSLFLVLPAAVGVLVFLLARRKKQKRTAETTAPLRPSPPSPPS